MSYSRQFVRSQWTDERREAANLAWRALRAYPDLEVVRFVLPFNLPPITAEPLAVAPTFHINTGTATRERLHLRCDGPGGAPDKHLVARIHDPRNDDTFYVSDSGNVFEVSA